MPACAKLAIFRAGNSSQVFLPPGQSVNEYIIGETGESLMIIVGRPLYDSTLQFIFSGELLQADNSGNINKKFAFLIMAVSNFRYIFRRAGCNAQTIGSEFCQQILEGNS